MSLRTVSKLLSRRPDDDIVLITPFERLTVGELLSRAEKHRNLLAAGRLKCEIRTNNIVDFVVSMLAFDGFVGSFVIESRTHAIEAAHLPPPGDNASLLQLGEMTQWILKTSGTSGAPKAIAHTLDTLVSTTKLNVTRGSEFRWGLLFDPSRFAGLQVVLQALLGGGILVVPQEGSLGEVIAFFAAQSVNAISATPSQWRKLLMTPGSGALHLRQVTLGGEIADQPILNAVRELYHEARVVHIYASTEAGVGFAVKDGLAGFPVEWLTSGALDEIDLNIGSSGNLMLRRKLQARLLGDLEEKNMTVDGYLDSGDLVEIRSGRVIFLGRSSGVINVGGNKVMPEQIEGLFLEHPAVVAAHVYARPSSFMGNLVAADVQIRAEFLPNAVRAEFVNMCRANLQRWQIPAVIRFVDNIDLGASGKITRNPKNDG